MVILDGATNKQSKIYGTKYEIVQLWNRDNNENFWMKKKKIKNKWRSIA